MVLSQHIKVMLQTPAHGDTIKNRTQRQRSHSGNRTGLQHNDSLCPDDTSCLQQPQTRHGFKRRFQLSMERVVDQQGLVTVLDTYVFACISSKVACLLACFLTDLFILATLLIRLLFVVRLFVVLFGAFTSLGAFASL